MVGVCSMVSLAVVVLAAVLEVFGQPWMITQDYLWQCHLSVSGLYTSAALKVCTLPCSQKRLRHLHWRCIWGRTFLNTASLLIIFALCAAVKRGGSGGSPRPEGCSPGTAIAIPKLSTVPAARGTSCLPGAQERGLALQVQEQR